MTQQDKLNDQDVRDPASWPSNAGGSSSSGSGLLSLVMLAALVALFTDNSLFSKFGEWIRKFLGNGDGSVNTLPEQIDNPLTNGLDEPSMYVALVTGWVRWYTASIIAGFQNHNVRTGNSYDEAIHSTAVSGYSLDLKWQKTMRKDLAYYSPFGELKTFQPNLNLTDFANADDHSWDDAFLTVVTLGIWKLWSYSLPLQSFCWVDGETGEHGFLSQFQTLWVGNISQNVDEGSKLIREKLITNPITSGAKSIKFGTTTITVREADLASHGTLGLDFQRYDISLANARGCDNSLDIERRLLDLANGVTPAIETIKKRDLYLSTSFYPFKHKSEMDDLIVTLSTIQKSLIVYWSEESNGDENLRPYSIPGAICPDCTIAQIPDNAPLTGRTVWNMIKSNQMAPQSWLWSSINYYMKHLQDEDLDFRLATHNGRKYFFYYSGSHDAIYRATCYLCYWIYLPLVCFGGVSIYDRASRGEIWGPNMFIDASPSSQAIEEFLAANDPMSIWTYIGSEDQPILENFRLSVDVLTSKCLPDHNEWLVRGAPSQFRQLV